jgi:hypothetical protein
MPFSCRNFARRSWNLAIWGMSPIVFPTMVWSYYGSHLCWFSNLYTFALNFSNISDFPNVLFFNQHIDLILRFLIMAEEFQLWLIYLFSPSKCGLICKATILKSQTKYSYTYILDEESFSFLLDTSFTFLKLIIDKRLSCLKARPTHSL